MGSMRMRGAVPAALMLVVAITLVFASGASARSSTTLRWSTPRLIDHTPPFGDPADLDSVACPTADTCLSVGEEGTIVSTTSTGNHVTTGIDGGVELRDIACPSASLCVIAESTALLTSTDPTAADPTWTKTRVPLGSEEYGGITCASSALCMTWTDSANVRVSTNPAGGASTWQTITLASERSGLDISSIGCARGSTLCVASLGGSGAISTEFATTTNPSGGVAAWTITTAPGTDSVDRISCPSTSLCVGIVYQTIETSTDPAAGASSWRPGLVIGPDALFGLEGIDCPTDTQCTAALGNGSVATSTNPSAGSPSYSVSGVIDANGFGTSNVYGIACPTTASCLVPDSNGGLANVTVATPPAAAVTTSIAGITAISGLACPSASLCLGVDDGGAILRTHTPASPASGWRRRLQPSAAQGLSSISCPSTQFCAAVGGDDTVLTTRAPATATDWHATRLRLTYPGEEGNVPFNLTSVACASAHLCVAGNGESFLMASTDPGGGPSAWKLLRVGSFNGDTYRSVSCPAVSLCVAADLAGSVFVSQHPAAGVKAWKRTRITVGAGSLAAEILSVSCPSTEFCLAGDSTGAVHVSTRPAGGRRTWKRVKIAGARLVGASCRSSTFCVVIDNRRQAFVSTDPTGPKRAWHAVSLNTAAFRIATSAEEGLTVVTCAKTKVCLAASGAGLVFAGT